MFDIAIVGAGGFGLRHAQSCATLPADSFIVHVVDPSLSARQRVAANLQDPSRIRWHSDVCSLPTTLDVAIVATRADVRAAVVKVLLTHANVRNLVLEKVLFQKLSEYGEIRELLRCRRVPTWVNCPRRIFPTYQRLEQSLDKHEIALLSASGCAWDLGCNGIHILDIFYFLAGATSVRDLVLSITEVKPSKRSGLLHVDGRLQGTLIAHGGREVPFSISSDASVPGPIVLAIKTARDHISVAEGPMITLRNSSGSTTEVLPAQSTLSAELVRSLVVRASCGLTTFEESVALHEPFLRVVLQALAGRGFIKDDEEACPIT
jgi:hypothetical protein